MSGLLNKNVLLTGCCGGMGRAMVKAFAEQKANIWACDINISDDFAEFVSQISQNNGVTIETFSVNLTDYDAVKNMVMKIRSNKRPVDVLINNAGILKEALLQMSSMDMARQLFEVNFFAVFYLTQLVSKLMIRQPQGGSIINMSSMAALDGVEGETLYGASKAAVYSMTKSLAKELGHYNIRANCLAPGITQTPLIKDMSEDVLQKDQNNTYLNRLGKPEEIADAAVFLASDASRYITGQIIRVDGGRN